MERQQNINTNKETLPNANNRITRDAEANPADHHPEQTTEVPPIGADSGDMEQDLHPEILSAILSTDGAPEDLDPSIPVATRIPQLEHTDDMDASELGYPEQDIHAEVLAVLELDGADTDLPIVEVIHSEVVDEEETSSEDTSVTIANGELEDGHILPLSVVPLNMASLEEKAADLGTSNIPMMPHGRERFLRSKTKKGNSIERGPYEPKGRKRFLTSKKSKEDSFKAPREAMNKEESIGALSAVALPNMPLGHKSLIARKKSEKDIKTTTEKPITREDSLSELSAMTQPSVPPARERYLEHSKNKAKEIKVPKKKTSRPSKKKP